MDGAQVVFVLHRLVLVVDLALEGIDDDGAVVRRDQIPMSHVLQPADHPLQLPWRRRAPGIPVLPRDVDLEQRLLLRRQHRLRASQAHGPFHVGQHRFRRRRHHGHHRRTGLPGARRLRGRSQLFNGSHQYLPGSIGPLWRGNAVSRTLRKAGWSSTPLRGWRGRLGRWA